jgi:hypothetical protein
MGARGARVGCVKMAAAMMSLTGGLPPIDILVAGAGRRHGEPVRIGLPMGRGVWTDAALPWLEAPDGSALLVQTAVTDRWSDGSARWVLVDFLADHAGPESTVYRLHPGGSATTPRPGPRVHAEMVDGVVRVATGPFTFTVGGQSLVRIGDGPSGSAATLTIEGWDASFAVRLDRAFVETTGPVRAVVRVEGVAGPADDPGRLVVMARCHFVAGSPIVECQVLLRNPRPAEHPGGIWELGEPRSALIRDASIVLAVPRGSAPGAARVSPEAGLPALETTGPVELFQASSGGDHWDSRNHVDRDGRVPLVFRGYRLQAGGDQRNGWRATPVLTQDYGDGCIGAAMAQFWQHFPKAIEAAESGITLRLFPRQHGSAYELQPGEQKTHRCHLAFARDTIADEPLDWVRRPLMASATPSYYCQTGAVPYLVPLDDEPEPAHAALVEAALDGGDSFSQKREVIDEFGWRHFGDLYADHEAAYYQGGAPPPIVSHYNNQYDAIAGFARQFLRSGDRRWWDLLCDLALHVVDIDIYHTANDKSAYSGGLFWHTAHYVDGGRSTHRSYPRDPGVAGGGPAAQHNYTTGLMLHYLLTGDAASREAAVGLGEWVHAMEDGQRTIFRWLARGSTGLATATHEPHYWGPGRAGGNSLGALLDAARLTRDPRHLIAAETLIRRTIHPADPIETMELLAAERRWSYTIFLHALGRYLDEKVERGALDAMYAYARNTLLAYARWMAAHERPYFDRRDELEYPTETWLAQELWKSDVFAYAAKYSADDRALFLERAAFFFHYAIEMLGSSPTRTFTRPMVLLLSRGLMHGFFLRHPEALVAPAPPAAPLPPRQQFVPQKAVARQRATLIAGIGAAALMGLALWALM